MHVERCLFMYWAELDQSPEAKRQRRNETVNQLLNCEKLLSELSKRDEAWPFQAPVTKREVSTTGLVRLLYVHVPIQVYSL